MATKIWHLVCQLADMHFCDQDGGTPLESDLDQGAGEEAGSPAGGARGMEELWWEGTDFIKIKIFISNIFAFSGREGHLARSQGLYGYSREW